MTRAGRKEAFLYDPEIKHTAKSLRKQANLRNQASKPFASASTTNLVSTIRSAAEPSETPAAAPVPAVEFIKSAAAPAATPPAAAALIPETEIQSAAQVTEEPAAAPAE